MHGFERTAKSAVGLFSLTALALLGRTPQGFSKRTATGLPMRLALRRRHRADLITWELLRRTLAFAAEIIIETERQCDPLTGDIDLQYFHLDDVT